MNTFGFKIYSLFILLLLFPCGLFGYEMEDCISCHSDNPGEGIPQVSARDYLSSIHGSMMPCTECHSYIEEGHEDGGVTEKVNCNNCHFQENLHGASSGRGHRPECYSCHTKHRILPEFVESSSINKSQLKNTCAKCHPAKWDEQGFLRWFTSIRIKSHGKEDFSRNFDETNCAGCHQGTAVHGKDEKISDDECSRCHLKDNKNAMMGRFHVADNSGSFITGLSITTQILVLAVLFFLARCIINPLSKTGKGEE